MAPVVLAGGRQECAKYCALRLPQCAARAQSAAQEGNSRKDAMDSRCGSGSSSIVIHVMIDGNFYLVDRDLGCSITASSVKIQSFAGAVFRKRTGAAGSFI